MRSCRKTPTVCHPLCGLRKFSCENALIPHSCHKHLRAPSTPRPSEWFRKRFSGASLGMTDLGWLAFQRPCRAAYSPHRIPPVVPSQAVILSEPLSRNADKDGSRVVLSGAKGIRLGSFAALRISPASSDARKSAQLRPRALGGVVDTRLKALHSGGQLKTGS